MVQYIYTLGAAGERLSVSELDRTVEYTYDNLYRLTGETITEGEKVTAYTYAYDNVGNRILKTKNGAETEYAYNELNQLVADSDNTYEYDLNGNLVRVIGGAQSALYEYNSENKLVKATVQQGINVVEESYTYDYAGNRTSKSTHTSDGNTEFVKYLNDNSSLTNVLAEINSEGEVSVYYTIGADLISQERDGRTYTYLYDGHGSVVGLMNESGSVTDTYTYDAFGNLLKSTGRTANNYRYCGEQFDSTTGLYYLCARYMDTSTGRFISQDSYAGSVYDPVSLHKYLYCNADPVNNIDPSGFYVDNEVAVLGESIIAVGLNAYNTTVLNIFLNITAAFLTVTAISAYTYLFTYYILDNINDIASGATNSAEVNAEVRDEAVDGATDGAGSGGAAPNPDNNGNKKPKKNKNEPPETDNLKWSKKAKKLFYKLSPEQQKMAIKTIMDFISGKSNHNNHLLSNNRVGQWALDIIGMGKGRGGGRIIYKVVDGVIEIIEIITGHNY